MTLKFWFGLESSSLTEEEVSEILQSVKHDESFGKDHLSDLIMQRGTDRWGG